MTPKLFDESRSAGSQKNYIRLPGAQVSGQLGQVLQGLLFLWGGILSSECLLGAEILSTSSFMPGSEYNIARQIISERCLRSLVFHSFVAPPRVFVDAHIIEIFS